MQQVREIISTKSSKIPIHENLDPRKFNAIQYESYICKAGMNVVISFTLQCNPPLVSYSAFKNSNSAFQKLKQNLFSLISRGRKSMLLFKLGKWLAVALMTSVGFGVTRPRTCWVRQNKGYQCVFFTCQS